MEIDLAKKGIYFKRIFKGVFTTEIQRGEYINFLKTIKNDRCARYSKRDNKDSIQRK